jgi:hypothetical protein
MPFVPTISILEALKQRLASLKLDETAGDEPLFEVVEYYGANDLVQALQDLVVIKQRVAIIIPHGWDHQSERTGVVLRAIRKVSLDIFLADRAVLKKTGAALIGGDKNVGTIAMAERVVNSLFLTPFETRELVFEPEDGAPIVLTKDDQKNASGREAWAQSFSVYAGEARQAVPQ